MASDVDRDLYSGGLQADASYALNDKHTLRAGAMLLDESIFGGLDHDGFPDGRRTGNPTGAPLPIVDNNVSHAFFAGIYLQDEWKILPKVTINYGARFDVFQFSSFDKENQPSPRVNFIYKPTDATTLHAGYARYFTPPPPENVSSANVAQIQRHVE